MTLLKYVSLLGLLSSHALRAQDAQPTENQCLIRIEVLDHRQQPCPEKITFENKISHQKWEWISDAQGKGTILLPRNQVYKVHLELLPNYDEIELPNSPYHIFEYQATSNKRLKQTAPLTTVQLRVHSTRNQPISEKVGLKSQKTQKIYETQLDATGRANLLLPNNDIYEVNYQRAPFYDKIVLPDKPNYTHSYEGVFNGSHPDSMYPALNKALFQLQFVDLDDHPVQGEKFYLENVHTKKLDSAITRMDGKAYLFAPLGNTYNVSAAHWKNFFTKAITPTQGIYKINVQFRFLPSAMFLRQQAEYKKGSNDRDADWQTWRVLRQKDKHAADVFWGIDTVYTAVLRRHPQWRQKMIVMDATGSMEPYTEEARLWYQLHFAQHKKLQFVLFNDGDHKLDALKYVGKSGGLYYCDSCHHTDFWELMDQVRANGNGGDAPENNIEALLAAVERDAPDSELIMVADCLSPVIDMELLPKLKKPVRIILCGTLRYKIHPDYLTIAYQTGGSVHTIERDIIDLQNMFEGSKIKIGKSIFTFTKGRFLLYKHDNE